MSSQDTIEVDPDKLSQDVVDELVEQNIMDEEEAENTGDEIWLNEVSEKNPDKVGIIEYTRLWCSKTIKFGSKFKEEMIKIGYRLDNSVKNKVNNLRKNQTIFAEVISVTPNQGSNEVCLKLSHNETGQFNITLDPKSKEMSNLLEYKSIENPKDLEGEKLILSNSFDVSFRKTQIVIPHNVSISGKIRFKLYSFSQELFEKTRFPSLYLESIDSLMFAHTVMFTLSGLVFTVGEPMLSGSILSTFIGSILMTPFVLWSILFVSTATHIIFTILNVITSIILNSDYHTVTEN